MTENNAAEIAAITRDHAAWVATEGREGKRGNFRGMDLTGVTLRGLHLVEASFRGANLTRAILAGADLRAADLAEAQLEEADLSDALLSGALLSGANLARANAARADLSGVDMTGVYAPALRLEGARLDNASLREANLEGANCAGASLQDANLRSAVLTGVNLTSVNLSGADCRDARFDGANFMQAQLAKANFKNATLEGVDMQTTDFSGVIDIMPEFHHQSMLQEKLKLQEEHTKLNAIRAELDGREKKLQLEKDRIRHAYQDIAALLAHHASYALHFQRYHRGFLVAFVLWLFVALAVLAFTLSVVAETPDPRMDILGVIVGTAVFIVLLAAFSMWRSRQIVRTMKELNAATPESEGLATATNADEDEPAAPGKRPGKRKGFGQK